MNNLKLRFQCVLWEMLDWMYLRKMITFEEMQEKRKKEFYIREDTDEQFCKFIDDFFEFMVKLRNEENKKESNKNKGE